eukprot:1542472-Rhodomonas_salina.1
MDEPPGRIGLHRKHACCPCDLMMHLQVSRAIGKVVHGDLASYGLMLSQNGKGGEELWGDRDLRK